MLTGRLDLPDAVRTTPSYVVRARRGAASHTVRTRCPPTLSPWAIMKLDHQAAFPIALTLVVGTLLGLTGAWLTSAAHSVVSRAAG